MEKAELDKKLAEGPAPVKIKAEDIKRAGDVERGSSVEHGNTSDV